MIFDIMRIAGFLLDGLSLQPLSFAIFNISLLGSSQLHIYFLNV